VEIAIAIGRTKPLSRWGPFGGNPAAAHDTVRFHLKQIGEVAANRYLKLKAYPPHTVVGDFDILVHAVSDPSADREAEYAFWYNAAFRREYAVREKYPGSVICDGAAIEQRPWFTISVDRPIADNACIAEK
jgi:hypothetical protein